jgi:hypothetical protein
LTVCCDIYGQEFSENYLNEDFMLYQGSLFKVKPTLDKIPNSKLYGYFEYAKDKYNSNVLYPEKLYSSYTMTDSLMDRVFRVKWIVGEDYKDFVKKSYGDEPIFLLEDIDDGTIIYYRYRTKSEYDFPFLVANLNINDDYYCNKVEDRVDEFTGERTMNSPIIIESRISPLIVYKNYTDKGTVYYLSLNTVGSTLNVAKRGVTILYEDGSKLEKPGSEIDTDATDHGYRYSAYIMMTERELSKFAKVGVDKFRLFIYDENVDDNLTNSFKKYVECLIKAD